MKERVRALRPEWLGGLFALFLASLLFAFGDAPKLIDELSNYPNPFDSRQESTTIAYRLPQDFPVRVRIYDLFGYGVRDFHFNPGEQGARAGLNQIQWDGRDDMGNRVSKGGYLCRVTVEGNPPVYSVRKIGVIH